MKVILTSMIAKPLYTSKNMAGGESLVTIGQTVTESIKNV